MQCLPVFYVDERVIVEEVLRHRNGSTYVYILLTPGTLSKNHIVPCLVRLFILQEIISIHTYLTFLASHSPIKYIDFWKNWNVCQPVGMRLMIHWFIHSSKMIQYYSTFHILSVDTNCSTLFIYIKRRPRKSLWKKPWLELVGPKVIMHWLDTCSN